MKQSDQKFPLVSIIVPVFNGEKTIRECLKEVLNSDYKSFEIIVVDDGSTDKTLEVVKNFGRVKLLTQTNSGSATAKNHGARNAKGEFFYFLDSDVVVFVMIWGCSIAILMKLSAKKNRTPGLHSLI